MRLFFLAMMLPLFGSVLLSAPTAAPTESVCHLTVNVPVGASLSVNGMRTEQMTAVRKFVSPPLPKGQKFYYTFLASYTHNGDSVTTKKIVEVTAGATITVNITSGETTSSPRPKISTPVSPFDSTDEEKKPHSKKKSK